MNDKKILLEKILVYNEQYVAKPSEVILEKLESILLDYLKTNPQDTDMWLKLAMVEFTPPWEDYDRIEGYIINILRYDSYNVEALLILAYADFILRGNVTQKVFDALHFSSSDDPEVLAMIDLAKAWYYEKTDKELYEKFLLSSIHHCDKQVQNLLELGELYVQKGKLSEGLFFIDKAISNVKEVCGKNWQNYDLTSVTRFLDEFFKGTLITHVNLNSIINKYKKYYSQA